MAYIDSPIQEIKQRLDVVDIVREYVPLQQAGANWKARCPFHNEKTPSFMVSKEKQIWHCFGCGLGGDVFAFVKEIEGVEFPEALRILAQKAGVVLKRQDPKLISVKTRLYDLMNEAVNFFASCLFDEQGEQARKYLDERGLTAETLKEWQIGWAPDSWDELGKHLRSKGFSDAQILNSGMTGRKNDGGFYDRFRGRIMFPINDVNGNAVGFTGRVLVETEKSGGKYVNTPQTMIYDKSRVVFGLDKAKTEIRKKDLTVIVEGQMDVISSHQAGVRNVVASSGTALTKQQIDLLSRYTKNLSFCFDADSAGEQATKRGIDLALSRGMNVGVIQTIGVKDADELIKNRGGDVWQSAIDGAVPIMRYYFDLVFAKIDIGNIEGKREAARQLLGEIARLTDRIEQDEWVKLLGSRLGVDERILRESVRNIEKRRFIDSTGSTKLFIGSSNFRPENKPRNVVLGERVVGCGLRFPETIVYWSRGLEPGLFVEEKLVTLAKSLLMYYNQSNSRGDSLGKFFDYNEFKKDLEEELREYADVLVMGTEKDFENLNLAEIKKEARILATNLRKEIVIGQLKKIEADLKKAETEGDRKRANEFNVKVGELVKELNKINTN